MPALSPVVASPVAASVVAPGLPRAPTATRRGNPDLALAPRCGARTRAGCPFRAPAIHDKSRCRMHGGRSTGPRTEDGMARMRAARTVHGAYGATTRAINRHNLTVLRRGRVEVDAVRCLYRLPPVLADRLARMPPELLPPPYPDGGLTPTQDRRVQREEVEALGPWRRAIAAAKQVARVVAAQAEAHAPVSAAETDDTPQSAPCLGMTETSGEAHAPGTFGLAHLPLPLVHFAAPALGGRERSGGAGTGQEEAHALCQRWRRAMPRRRRSAWDGGNVGRSPCTCHLGAATPDPHLGALRGPRPQGEGA
jgi:hypothetical protein